MMRSPSDAERQDLVEIQARILCTVAMAHSRNENLIERAYVCRSKLVTTCLRRKMLHKAAISTTRDVSPDRKQWDQWVLMEEKIRAGYCIWVSAPKLVASRNTNTRF